MAVAPQCLGGTGGDGGNWIADGMCDMTCNIPECGYDGGDCCPDTCTDAGNTCGDYDSWKWRCWIIIHQSLLC